MEYQITLLTGETMFFECPAQESHCKFSVTNKMDGDFWEIIWHETTTGHVA
jgi:hypothetical protein